MNGRKAVLFEVLNDYEITIFETQPIIRRINQKAPLPRLTVMKRNID